MDSLDPDYVTNLFNNTNTNVEMVRLLQNQFPGERGFSIASLKRYLQQHGLYRLPHVPEQQMDNLVAQSVRVLGPGAGRNYIRGHLRATGAPTIGDRRIRRSLVRQFPNALQTRRRGPLAARLAPQPYRAEYVGHRIHLDQNEKMTGYGVTLVAAIDGLSGLILKAIAMPLKSSISVYDAVFRPIVLQYGLFDQVIVDQGGEFYLSLAVQRSLSEFRTCHQRLPGRPPYRQIPSVKNNRIERFWVEVNSRVHEPVIVAIESLVDRSLVDLNCRYQQFGVSQASLRVVQAGLNEHVNARNNRHVRGRGIPSQLILHNRAAQINPNQIPETADAARAYNDQGGNLQDPQVVGSDPLQNQAIRTAREASIPVHLTDFTRLFAAILQGHYDAFLELIRHFVYWNG